MVHQVSNALNFETIQDEYRCKHCHQFAQRDWCGAQKAIEYNSNTETMTIWYQGLQKCTLRPGHKSKEIEHQGKEALKTEMHMPELEHVRQWRMATLNWPIAFWKHTRIHKFTILPKRKCTSTWLEKKGTQ